MLTAANAIAKSQLAIMVCCALLIQVRLACFRRLSSFFFTCEINNISVYVTALTKRDAAQNCSHLVLIWHASTKFKFSKSRVDEHRKGGHLLASFCHIVLYILSCNAKD